MGRVVVGVDGSEQSVRALQWAAREAERRGAALEVVAVWHSPYQDMWVPSDPPGTDHLAPLRHHVDRLVAGVVGDPPTVEAEVIVVDGHPAHVLLERAEGADLLVVGNRGRGGVAGAVLGSVSLHCVAHAPCPVVVVRGVPAAA